MDSYLGEKLSIELSKFIHEDEWTNENIFDETELYEKSYEELDKRKSPPIDIKTNIVNFYNALSEKEYWDRVSLGDIVRVQNKQFATEYKATLTGMSLNFDDASISVAVSNGKKLKKTMTLSNCFIELIKHLLNSTLGKSIMIRLPQITMHVMIAFQFLLLLLQSD